MVIDTVGETKNESDRPNQKVPESLENGAKHFMANDPSRSVHSKVLSVEELFNLGQFHPANVQRNFKWGIQQGDQLISDLIAMMNESVSDAQAAQGDQSPSKDDDVASGVRDGMSVEEVSAPESLTDYYLGSLILKPDGNGEIQIYDGLQRMTTLTILVSVLRDIVKEPVQKARLHILIENQEEKYVRLHHARPDKFLRFKIQKLGEAGRRRTAVPDWNSGRLIFEIARSFRKHLAKETQVRLEQLTDYILERAVFNVTFMQQQRAARQAFITSNLYVLPLTREEVFKGQLIAIAGDFEAQREAEKRWDKIRTKIEAEREEFEDFIKSVDMIERRRWQSTDYLGDLIDHLEKRTKTEGLSPWLEAVDGYADAWNLLQKFMHNANTDPVGRHVRRLSHFYWKDWMPLALHYMERYLYFQADKTNMIGWRKKQNEFNKTVFRFATLSERCMAMTILDATPRQRMGKFVEAIQKVRWKHPREPFTRGTADRALNFDDVFRQRIKNNLRLPLENFEIRRSLMLWYEEVLWGDKVSRFWLGGDKRVTVEHLLPRRVSEGSQWMIDFPDFEQRNRCMTSLGNLCLVDYDVNDKELSNKDYRFKHPILKRRGQFGRYKTTSDLWRIKTLTEPVIVERTKKMADHIWKLLQLPEPI